MSGAANKPVLALRAEFPVIMAPKVASVFFATTDAFPSSERRARALLILSHGEGWEPPFTLSLKYGRRRKAEPGLSRITFERPRKARGRIWTYANFDLDFAHSFSATSTRVIALREFDGYLQDVVGIDCSRESAPSGRTFHFSFVYDPTARARLEAFPEGVLLVGGTVLSEAGS